ncbi:MAG: DMT family transporter [Pseudomonadota bacterium]
MPNTLHYAAIMLTAGIGIPILAALNAALGKHIGAPFAASVALFAIAMIASVVAMLLTHSSHGIAAMASAPKHLFFGGVLIAFYVLSITAIAPRFGIGNAVFFVLLGQLISAALIDHFGLFGAVKSPLTALRAAGILTMAFGVYLTQRA